MSASRVGAYRTHERVDVLGSAEAADWNRRLRATAHPCGCKSGAAMSLVALVGWPVFVIVTGRFPRSILGAIAAIFIYGVVVIGAGMIGKVAGIVVGRLRHDRLRQQLLRRLTLVAEQQA